MTIYELEALLTDSKKGSTVYAALTLTRILASEWTHCVVEKGPGKGQTRQVTVTRPAGQTFGSREELQRRLDTLLGELA